MQNSFSQALDFRHACKIFDENKKIPKSDIDFILEAGRKSPSSFGMEPWRFIVVTNNKLKQDLKSLCWNQPQITTCSHLMILLAKIEDLKVTSGVPKTKFQRRDLSKEKIDAYVQKYSHYLENFKNTDEKIFAWSSEQVHIAAANMMTAAAIKNIDSCPIGGFIKSDVEKLLNLDIKKEQASLIIAFGYRIEPQPKKLRANIDDIVEYI